MRASNRDRIVEGALELALSSGFEALTFEALAEHVGLTRGGLVYHFATKQALLEGIAATLLSRWRAQAQAELGKPVEDSSRSERIRALAASTVGSQVLPGELSFLLSGGPEAAALAEAWSQLCRDWIGDPGELDPIQRVAILAIDGWWANQALQTGYHDPDDEETRRLIIALAAGDRAL